MSNRLVLEQFADVSSSNVPSTIVKRDASGNFSAGTITASLSGNATTATHANTADSATNATNATNAVTAASATTAANATHATNADNASYAVTAGGADTLDGMHWSTGNPNTGIKDYVDAVGDGVYDSGIINVNIPILNEVTISHGLGTTAVVISKMERQDSNHVWAVNVSTQLGGSNDAVYGGIIRVVDANTVKIAYDSSWGHGFGAAASHGPDSFSSSVNTGQLRVVVRKASSRSVSGGTTPSSVTHTTRTLVSLNNSNSSTVTDWIPVDLPAEFVGAKLAIIEVYASQCWLCIKGADDTAAVADLAIVNSEGYFKTMSTRLLSTGNNNFLTSSRTVNVQNGRFYYYYQNDGGNTTMRMYLRTVIE